MPPQPPLGHPRWPAIFSCRSLWVVASPRHLGLICSDLLTTPLYRLGRHVRFRSRPAAPVLEQTMAQHLLRTGQAPRLWPQASRHSETWPPSRAPRAPALPVTLGPLASSLPTWKLAHSTSGPGAPPPLATSLYGPAPGSRTVSAPASPCHVPLRPAPGPGAVPSR